MILVQHRIETTEAELVQAAQMQFGGVDIEELARLAKRFGLHAELRQLDLAAIAELTFRVSSPRPPSIPDAGTPLRVGAGHIMQSSRA